MVFKGAKYLIDQMTVIFEHRDPVQKKVVEREINLIGLPQETIIRLALEGVVRRVGRSQNPEQAMHLIETGQLDGIETKNYPRIVKAIAQIEELPARNVYKKWRTLSKQEKRKYRQDPRIRQLFLEWSGAEKADMSIFNKEVA